MVASVSKMGRDSWRYYHERAAGCPTDYHSGKGEHSGQWYGEVKALDVLGLTRDAPVTEQEMADLYGWGLHPRTRDVLGRLGGPNSIAGFGVTFSSPKSFSAAWALADPETAYVFDAAHQAGVRAGLDFLSRHAMWSRIGAGGAVQIATAGLVAAVYQHSTARPTPWSPGDPQKHTHCLIPNKVLCVDGVWRALDGREIYAHAKAAQAVALAVERAHLARELGVVFEPTNEHGHSEIAGVPTELTKAWSKRRAQIESWSDAFIDQINHERIARGLPAMSASAEAACRQEAALQTRRAKVEGEAPAERHARWRQEAEDLGVDVAHLVRDLIGNPVIQAPPDLRQTGFAAVDRVSERKATFTRNDVVVAVSSLLPTSAIGPDEVPGWVETCIDSVLDNPDQVIALPSERNAERRWVTGRQLMLEARVLTTVASGAIPDRPGIDPVTVEARLDMAYVSGRELTDGQREAVRQLCRGNRYGFLVAPAGAGKTTAMSAVADLHAKAGFEVVGLAPSARAARVLADETGAPAKTLARYLRDGCRGLNDQTLVLVDEAGMVGSYDWGRLIDAIEARGARLRAIGDPRQLTAPGQPGDLFDVLVRCPTRPASCTRSCGSSNPGTGCLGSASPGHHRERSRPGVERVREPRPGRLLPQSTKRPRRSAGGVARRPPRRQGRPTPRTVTRPGAGPERTRPHHRTRRRSHLERRERHR